MARVLGRRRASAGRALAGVVAVLVLVAIVVAAVIAAVTGAGLDPRP